MGGLGYGSLFFHIATEGALGVAPANEHLFFIIASPVGDYFKGDLKALSVKVETECTRAAAGGVAH